MMDKIPLEVKYEIDVSDIICNLYLNNKTVEILSAIFMEVAIEQVCYELRVSYKMRGRCATIIIGTNQNRPKIALLDLLGILEEDLNLIYQGERRFGRGI